MQISFEDEKILVLEKEPGFVTTNEGSVFGQSVQNYLNDSFGWARGLPRAGICHRLDKDTSGLLLVAKDLETLDLLKFKFKNRTIEKTYTALVKGRVPIDGCIEVPIGKSTFFAKRKVGILGTSAVTYFKILRRYRNNNIEFSLLNLFPKTGRTHQIRVHCNYMGWPLVGDRLYGGNTAFLSRQFLHASALSFEVCGKKYQLQSELPSDLGHVLDLYEEKY